MTGPIEYAEAERLIVSNRTLSHAVAAGLSGVPLQHHKLCCRCAGYLYASGWLAGRPPVTGLTSRSKMIREARRDSVHQLQNAGILPSGLTWLFLRWVVLPFLWAFLSEWLLSGEPDQ
jgi:hypothetical protein